MLNYYFTTIINPEKLISSIIIYGIIMLAINTITAVYSIRKRMSNKAIGIIDIITGMFALFTLQELHNNALLTEQAYILGIIGYITIILAGTAHVTTSILSCDARC